jgi:dienelactone hydrolase
MEGAPHMAQNEIGKTLYSVFHETPRGMPDGRLGNIRSLNTPWTLKSSSSLSEWEDRATYIRQHILVTLGLNPLPKRTPLKPRIFGRVVRDGYSVEKVFFESIPGYYVCGNLYRPAAAGRHPGVLCPHGHCAHGRLENDDESFGSIPGRCINLARQGYIAFSYDMAGYNDTNQISHRKFGDSKEEDLWGIGLMGLQLWNSIRGVDFLESLPDVDTKRIGCTGASGGGTQTFMLTAVDKRIKVSAPVNMVSAHMQGGCNCENQSHLRLDINNIEIAALMAPRPMFLVSATGDWTCNTPYLEFPAIQSIYKLYGEEGKVATAQVDAGHNYNRESREHVYTWFSRWLQGNTDGKRVRESPFSVEEDEDLLVFHNRKRPSSAIDADTVKSGLVNRSQNELRQLRPTNRVSVNRIKRQMGTGLRHAIGAEYPADPTATNMGFSKRDDFLIEKLILGRSGTDEKIPGLLFRPLGPRKTHSAAMIVHPKGKSGLIEPAGLRPCLLVRSLLQASHMVLAIDLLGQGENSGPRRSEEVHHFHTYNPSDASCRIQDILTGMAYLNTRTDVSRSSLVGLGASGPETLMARSLAPRSKTGKTIIDANRFQASSDRYWAKHLYIPAIRSSGDFRTAAVMIAPDPLLIFNTGLKFPVQWIRNTYKAVGSPKALQLSDQRLSQRAIATCVTGE